MDIKILALTAASVGFFHTLLGPDHYVPFIALAKARGWSYLKTGVITFLCGIGHVGSSVLLGFVGIFIGAKVTSLQAIEASRGSLAGWLLLTFGLLYFIWGFKRAYSGGPHQHEHAHDLSRHTHSHSHSAEHVHVHETGKATITPWILFTIFVFGPCEPLIPLMMYPAAKGDMIAVGAVTFIFGAITIGTMMSMVLASFYGLSKLPLPKLERYSHALAGFSIFLCGGAIKFLGL